MAESRMSLTRMLYLNGALAVAVLTVLVYLLLRWVTALAGLDLRDDPLASAWYRAQLLPRLVGRALANLQETP